MKTIFVSSTFSDMQYERDILQEKVLPIVNSRAKRYGDAVSFCDLRWGVNTLDLDSEAGEEKVLDICLDMIDRCDPVMIIILGERYGWIPDPSMVKAASERKKMHLDNYNMSVTALEIEYGAFFKKKNTLVYYREVEGSDKLTESDPERAQKLSQLKKRIYTLTGGNVKTYKVRVAANGLQGADNFANMVADDVCNLLSSRWKEYENLSPVDRELIMHQSVFDENASNCSTQGGVDEKIVDYVKHGKRRIINLSGDSGTGKSVALGKVAQQLKKDGYTVLPFSVGYTANSTTSNGILHSIVSWFEEKCGYNSEGYGPHEPSLPWYNKSYKDLSLMDFYNSFFNAEDISETVGKLSDYCREFDAEGKKLVIIVDGMDKVHIDAATDLYCFIPQNIYQLENIMVIFSSVSEYKSLDLQHFTTETFDKEQNRRILSSILEKNNREIDLSVEEEILNKSSGQYPQYIKLLVTRLLMLNASDFRFMTDMKNISEYQKSVLRGCADTLGLLGVEIITEACRRINGGFLMQALRFMSVTREGLTEDQIRFLCKDQFNKLDFYHLISYMDDSFILRDDGRYDFKTSYMKEGIFKGIQNPSRYAISVLEMFINRFVKEEASKADPDYTQVQEIAKLASDFCSDAQFMAILKRFYELSRRFVKDGKQPHGAYACMDVLLISISREGDRLVKFAKNCLDSYSRNRCNYNYYDVLFVVNEVVLSSCFDVGDKKIAAAIYKNCLKVYEDLPKEEFTLAYVNNKVSIAENLFDALCGDTIEDEDAALKSFNIIVKDYTNLIMNMKDITFGDQLSAYNIILKFVDKVQRSISRDDPDDFLLDLVSDSVESVKEIIKTLSITVIAYSDQFFQEPEAVDGPLATLIKAYNFCAEVMSIIKDYVSEKSMYGLSIMYYLMSESLRANVYEYDIPSLAHMYEKLAGANFSICTKESLNEAIEDYKAAREADEDSDEFTFYENIDSVYAKLCEIDDSATDARIAHLNMMCAAKDEFIYQTGIKFYACYCLAQIYKDRHVANLEARCLKNALDIIIKLAGTIKDRCGDNSVHEYLDVFAASYSREGEDFNTMISNNIYISIHFSDDVDRADEIFDRYFEILKSSGDSLKLMALQSMRKKFDKIVSAINFAEDDDDE